MYNSLLMYVHFKWSFLRSHCCCYTDDKGNPDTIWVPCIQYRGRDSSSSDGTLSEGVVEVQLRLHNRIALLVVEYKLRILPQSQQQTLAQLFAKLLCEHIITSQTRDVV